MWCNVHQIVDVAHLVIEVDGGHVEDLHQRMVEVGLDYNVGSISCNPSREHDKTMEDITEVVDGKWVLKDGEVIGTVDGRE